MATSTITATIGLSGPGMTSQTLAVGRATTLTIGSPTIESGAQTVPTAGYTTLVDGTDLGAVAGHFYIKNTEPTTAACITIYHGAVAAGQLKPGHWAFFPVTAGEIIKVQADIATTCEYGFWTAA